jgi:hypothetical protein
VADRVDAVKGAVKDGGGLGIGQVGVDVLDLVTQVGGTAGVGAGVETVEGHDLVAALDQEVDDVAAHEPGAAGDQDAHGQPGSRVPAAAVNAIALTNW